MPAGDEESVLGEWPHRASSMFAGLTCTIGIFNVSRFAILALQFGGNFVVQFMVMSLLVGTPLLTYHMSIGQLLSSGSMDMWKISPLLQGIGISLVISQALMGIYSIVGTSWMLVYFRDSFITKEDFYRWTHPFQPSTIDGVGSNESGKLETAIPDYFNGVVLQRSTDDINKSPLLAHRLTDSHLPSQLKFQLVFNLAVVWMIVFISLSKGLKSYGKVVCLFCVVPVVGLVGVCWKLASLSVALPSRTPLPTNNNFIPLLLPNFNWSDFFINTKSWCAALSEAFYTWGFLGAAAKQMASHNRHKHALHRDTTLITILTITVLLMSAFLANTCTQILIANGFLYVPSSFEERSTRVFLQSLTKVAPSFDTHMPIRWMSHVQLVAGERIVKPGTNSRLQSGYQPLRLATELVPATFAVLASKQLSPIWSVLFYFILILFGIAQQLAIMHCVITGVMAIKGESLKHWETTITFFACASGFILGLPMATEVGIFVFYLLDCCVGGGWWIIALYMLELGGVFVVRGRPYSGETVVATLFAKANYSLQSWAAPILSFIWNVILPVIMMMLCVGLFKNGNYGELLRWGWSIRQSNYWPDWSRRLAILIQLGPILIVPVVGLVQLFRYLYKGPPDLFDRLERLYRPRMQADRETIDDLVTQVGPEVSSTALAQSDQPSSVVIPDPPPKYTPPPSYTTATGARVAKLLRQSIRRSVCHLTRRLGGGSETRAGSSVPSPPSYASVVVEMNGSGSTQEEIINTPSLQESGGGTSRRGFVHRNSGRASILRNSFRSAMRDTIMSSSSSQPLVHNVAPINQDSFIVQNYIKQD